MNAGAASIGDTKLEPHRPRGTVVGHRLNQAPDEVASLGWVEHIPQLGELAKCFCQMPLVEICPPQVTKLSLSVRQTETLVKGLLADKKPAAKPKQTLPAELVALRAQFEHTLGTRVDILKGSRGGRVVIHYYSDGDLQAIYEAITNEE